jgi:general stress protein YciG
MAEIGRKGGQAVSKNREHMANIGRKGGAASRGTVKEPIAPINGNEGKTPETKE